MNDLSLLSQVHEDYVAHRSDWSFPGFRAIAVYRFGVWRMKVKPKLLRAPLSMLYRYMFRRVRNVYGIELPYTASIGRRVVFEHQSGIVIHGASIIGDDCIIRQGVTLGVKDESHLEDAPVLGNGVSVGAGAVILGKIYVGDHVKIGANAVVTKDVPARSVVVGVPAKVIRTYDTPLSEGSNDE